jgi:hypothetical protein
MSSTNSTLPLFQLPVEDNVATLMGLAQDVRIYLTFAQLPRAMQCFFEFQITAEHVSLSMCLRQRKHWAPNEAHVRFTSWPRQALTTVTTN